MPESFIDDPYIYLAQLRWIGLALLERLRVRAFELIPFTSCSLVLLVIFVTWYHLIPTRDYLELGCPLELKESSSEELISKFSSCGCQFIYELVVNELVISKLDIDDLSIWRKLNLMQSDCLGPKNTKTRNIPAKQNWLQ